MPAKSPKQARLMRAAEHGATFAKAKEIRASMSSRQIHEFTHTKAEKPREKQVSAYNWRSRRNLKRGR